MSRSNARQSLPTHEVTNQPPERGDTDLWTSDPVLRDCATRAGARAIPLAAYGAALGRSETRDAGRDANMHPPELCLFDRGGRRLDEVRFHPTYHHMMDLSQSAGYAAPSLFFHYHLHRLLSSSSFSLSFHFSFIFSPSLM